MEELFSKFCRYYVLKGTEEELEELKELSKDKFKEYQKKALKYAKNLRHKTSKMGFGTDFESFCNMLEDYIEKKDKMSDDDKKNYLKILVSLSTIHNINLREELERYVSYKETHKSQETPSEIFKKFCRYNINHNDSVEDFNELKDLASLSNIDFNELQQKSISFVEEIKILTEKLGFNTDKESLYLMVDEYQNQKKQMTDSQKSSYLRILLYLSEIYDINLRELLIAKKDDKINPSQLNINILSEVSNPLDNNKLLDDMLKERYHNGSFDIETLYEKDNDNKEDNSNDLFKIQSNLTYKLYRIFLDKMSNYAYDDLNIKYTSLITDEELYRLDTLSEEEIYNILLELNKNEQKHYICKKYKLTENLYNFISLSLKEATNFNNEVLDNNYSLFNVTKEQPTISIYLNGNQLVISKILSEYIKYCVQNNLWYEIRRSNKSNTYILSANENDINEKTHILNNISHSVNTKKLNINPICGTIDNSYYGISTIGFSKNNNLVLPYYEYIDYISEVSYYRVLAKLAVNKVEDEKALDILKNFINLTDFEVLINSHLDIKCNNINFDTIKDLINQYIPLIINTLQIYITEDEQRKNLVSEFKKSLLYLSNLINNKEKKDSLNICLFNNF